MHVKVMGQTNPDRRTNRAQMDAHTNAHTPSHQCGN
jgi:hypothetical protein